MTRRFSGNRKVAPRAHRDPARRASTSRQSSTRSRGCTRPRRRGARTRASKSVTPPERTVDRLARGRAEEDAERKKLFTTTTSASRMRRPSRDRSRLHHERRALHEHDVHAAVRGRCVRACRTPGPAHRADAAAHDERCVTRRIAGCHRWRARCACRSASRRARGRSGILHGHVALSAGASSRSAFNRRVESPSCRRSPRRTRRSSRRRLRAAPSVPRAPRAPPCARRGTRAAADGARPSTSRRAVVGESVFARPASPSVATYTLQPTSGVEPQMDGEHARVEHAGASSAGAHSATRSRASAAGCRASCRRRAASAGERHANRGPPRRAPRASIACRARPAET